MKRLKFGCKFPSKWLSFQSQSTVLSRLKEQTRSNEPVHTHLNLSRPSQAHVDRYDRLRSQQMSGQEVSHA